MTDWQDAVNLMKVEEKKRRTKKKKETNIGLRCWECGLYLDNLGTGHYCTRCFVRNLKKYMNIPQESCKSKDLESSK